MKLLIFTFFLLLTQMAVGSNHTTINGKENTGQCATITLLDSLPLRSLQTDDFTITSVTIEDSCLVIAVTYGGGCGTTNFELFWNKMITECRYPSVNVFLKLTDDDFCKAIISETVLKFDLTAFGGLRESYGLGIRIMGTEFLVSYGR